MLLVLSRQTYNFYQAKCFKVQAGYLVRWFITREQVFSYIGEAPMWLYYCSMDGARETLRKGGERGPSKAVNSAVVHVVVSTKKQLINEEGGN